MLSLKNLVLIVLFLLLSACSFLSSPAGAKAVLVAKDVLCVIEHAYLDEPVMNELCDLLTVERQAAGKAIASSYRSQVSRDAVMRASICAPVLRREASDAGSEGGLHAVPEGGSK